MKDIFKKILSFFREWTTVILGLVSIIVSILVILFFLSKMIPNLKHMNDTGFFPQYKGTYNDVR